MLDSSLHIKKRIFSGNVVDFDDIAIDLFNYQYQHNDIYKSYVSSLGINVEGVRSIATIPFLPISAFKHYKVKSGQWRAEDVFLSSGTTQLHRSKHYVRDRSVYLKHSVTCFEEIVNLELANSVIIACLPSYHDQKSSSLIAMIDHFISLSDDNLSGFYKDDFKSIDSVLKSVANSDKNVILFGVTYALLDFLNFSNNVYNSVKLFVTGGMKGRKKELTPNELFKTLSSRFLASNIYGEYGMTELMSQAYSRGDFKYLLPSTIKASAVELTDPFQKVGLNKTGLLQIIDLANVDSCAFIQTEDLCRIDENGCVEILGRLDYSDIRGCSLLTA